MTKLDFDNLVGMVTDPICFERIDYVYMNSDRFNTKQEIADFYKEKDMNGIEKIYHELRNTHAKSNNTNEVTYYEILSLAHSKALEYWCKRKERVENGGGELAKHWERKTWAKMDAIGKLLLIEEQKKCQGES